MNEVLRLSKELEELLSNNYNYYKAYELCQQLKDAILKLETQIWLRG